eukprot:881928-Rhodomonas_salina.1
MPMMARPTWLQGRHPWPPAWSERWEPIGEKEIWRFIPCLFWMGLHKTQNEEELWSTHWAFQRPAAKRFMTFAQFKVMKAALHAQNEGKAQGVTDMDGKPVLSKIGIIMET